MYIRSRRDLHLVCGDNSSGYRNVIYADNNGTARLYHPASNAVRLNTSTAGVSITGALTTNNGGGNAVLGSHLDLGDNQKVRCGASDDLEIYHSGTESWIKDTGTGNLYLASNKIVFQNAATNEDMAVFSENGAVELYHNNVKKLETAADRVNITGHIFITDGSSFYINNGFQNSYARFRNAGGSNDANLEFLVKDAGTENEALEITKDSHIRIPNDNKKLKFGADDDLLIYHSGSHSYIQDAGTGSLILVGGNVTMQNAAQTENMFSATENGAVDLFYDNVSKAKTASHGMYFNEAYQHQYVNSGNSIELRFTTAGVRRGSVYADNGNTVGFLTPSGGWSARWHSTGKQTSHGDIVPNADNTYSLGNTSLRWANIFTTDLQLSNKGKTNDVDGTWGDYTIQEGEDELFLINNRSGKKYAFLLKEIN